MNNWKFYKTPERTLLAIDNENNRAMQTFLQPTGIDWLDLQYELACDMCAQATQITDDIVIDVLNAYIDWIKSSPDIE